MLLNAGSGGGAGTLASLSLSNDSVPTFVAVSAGPLTPVDGAVSSGSSGAAATSSAMVQVPQQQHCVRGGSSSPRLRAWDGEPGNASAPPAAAAAAPATPAPSAAALLHHEVLGLSGAAAAPGPLAAPSVAVMVPMHLNVASLDRPSPRHLAASGTGLQVGGASGGAAAAATTTSVTAGAPKFAKWPSHVSPDQLSREDSEPSPAGGSDGRFDGHPVTLHFKSSSIERQYRLLIRHKYSRSLWTRAIISFGFVLVTMIPVLSLATSQAVVPSATVAVCAVCSLLAASSILVMFIPSKLLASHWNWWVILSNLATMTPMYFMIIVCMRDGLSTTMHGCTPQYEGITPLLQAALGLVGPPMVSTFTRASWYITMTSAIAMWVCATAMWIVSNESRDQIICVSLLFAANIGVSSIIAFNNEKSERASMWLGILNKQGAAVLERTVDAHAEQVRRNITFMSFAAATNQVLYELDVYNRFVTVEAASQEVFGCDCDAMVGRSHNETIVPEDRPVVEDLLNSMWKGTSVPVVHTFRRLLPNNVHKWVEMVAVLEHSGSQMKVVASERDVTAQAQARETIALQNQQRVAALATQAAQDEILGYACHELRNPLHVINASVDVLCGAETAAADQNLAAIKLSAKQMRTLVDDILDVERLRAGKLAIVPQPFDPSQLMHDAAVQHSDFARVPVLFDGASDLPPVLVAPVDRIQQVINNGLTNAAKFCNSGIIRVRALRGSKPSTVRFEVRNSGAPSVLPQLRSFGFADQIAQAQDQNVKGSGLGLRIAVSLVSAMGGTLHLELLPVVQRLEGSLDDSETCFWFEIPYQTGGSMTTAPTPAPAPTLKSELGLHVLVVDDEELNRRVAVSMLRKLGCTSDTLDDGDQVMANHPDTFDVILMDIVMQRMRGDEVIGVMRSAGVTTPCIAVTGNTDPTSIQAYRKAGFDAVLGKPFSASELSQHLRPYSRFA